MLKKPYGDLSNTESEAWHVHIGTPSMFRRLNMMSVFWTAAGSVDNWFKTIIQVGAGPVSDRLPQHAADRPGAGAMTACHHALRPKAHGRLSRAEERLGCLHVVVLVEHGVDQVSVPVDGPIEVGPAVADLQTGRVDILDRPSSTTRSKPALAEGVARNRQELHAPNRGKLHD